MKTEKSVLLVSCEGLGRGGVQSIMMTIKRHIKNCTIDALLFTDEKRFYDEEFTKLGGIIYRVPIKRKSIFDKIYNYIKIFHGLGKILRENKYDIIHCHNEIESWICLMVAKKFKVPIRISHHHCSNYLNNKNAIYRIFFIISRRLIVRYSTSIVCCSQKTKKNFFGRLDSNKIVVINNPVDLNMYSGIRVKHDGIELCNVGSYSKVKNQLFLVDVMSVLVKKISNVHLSLVGFGEDYRVKLKKKINQYQLDGCITLEDGTKANAVINALKKTDVFLFPSIKEGFGISLIEAQAMGIKCIASTNVPLDTDVGLVTYLNIDEPKAWADEIIFLLADETKRLDINKIQEFSIDRFLRNIMELYKIN